MLVEDGGEFPVADGGGGRREAAREHNLRYIRISFERGRAPRLDQNHELQVRPPGMQRRKSGCLENDIAKRAETKN